MSTCSNVSGGSDASSPSTKPPSVSLSSSLAAQVAQIDKWQDEKILNNIYKIINCIVRGCEDSNSY